MSYYDFKIKSEKLLVYDDIKFEFFHRNKLSQQKIFHFWLHTSFLEKSGIVYIEKQMIEKASSDKRCSKFDKNFRIEIHMSET